MLSIRYLQSSVLFGNLFILAFRTFNCDARFECRECYSISKLRGWQGATRRLYRLACAFCSTAPSRGAFSLDFADNARFTLLPVHPHFYETGNSQQKSISRYACRKQSLRTPNFDSHIDLILMQGYRHMAESFKGSPLLLTTSLHVSLISQNVSLLLSLQQASILQLLFLATYLRNQSQSLFYSSILRSTTYPVVCLHHGSRHGSRNRGRCSCSSALT